ncbi:MAG: RNA methyltransferase [Leptospiraceae bacterium]|nr:RNA methyltransferase [Leptospiraceae bacterium]MCP5511923.1 RNA methyltransferase [Leptospiraceae bacterium]
MLEITSFSNEKVKFASGLKEKKNRIRFNQIFIEGYREILRGSESDLKFTSLYISPECFLGENEDSLIDTLKLKDSQIFRLPRKVFEKISMRDRPDGLIALAETPEVRKLSTSTLIGDLFLVIEGVEKPGNFGTILRTAEGAGVDAVILMDPKLDLFNPNVIRASTGTLFSMPIYQNSWEECNRIFTSKKVQVLAVTPEGKSQYYRENLKKPTVLLYGSEQYGLSDEIRASDVKKVNIPMLGKADSLNLAMSVGIVLYETIRQRDMS